MASLVAIIATDMDESHLKMNAAEHAKEANQNQVAERRLRMPAVPDDLLSLLSQEQRIALNQKQQFGWFVKFVRRPLFQPIEVVLSNPDGSEFVSLEHDGITRPFFNVRTDDLR